MPACPECSTPIVRTGKRGPAPTYCSDRCRSRVAYRKAAPRIKQHALSQPSPCLFDGCGADARSSEGRKRKWCEEHRAEMKRRSVRKAQNRPNAPTCNEPNCGRSLRARGLCNTHYNRTHQPNRHRKVEMHCGWCGITVMKDAGSAKKFAAVYCSLQHRDFARTGKGECEPLPNDHWGRWYGSTSAWEGPQDLPTRPTFQVGKCHDCEATIVEPSAQTPSRWCSERCARRVSRRSRKAREHSAAGQFRYADVIRQYLRQGSVCAYCRQPCDGLPDPEHVIPLSRGGDNSMSNIVAACRPCNADKRDLTPYEWQGDRERRGLRRIRIDLTGPAYAHLALTEPTPRHALAA